MNNFKILALLFMSAVSGVLFGMEVDVPNKPMLNGKIFIRTVKDVFYAPQAYHDVVFGPKNSRTNIPIVFASIYIYENQQQSKELCLLDSNYNGAHKKVIGDNFVSCVLLCALRKKNIKRERVFVQESDVVSQEYSNYILRLSVYGCSCPPCCPLSDKVDQFKKKLKIKNIIGNDKGALDELINTKVIIKEEWAMSGKIILFHGQSSYLRRCRLLSKSENLVENKDSATKKQPGVMEFVSVFLHHADLVVGVRLKDDGVSDWPLYTNPVSLQKLQKAINEKASVWRMHKKDYVISEKFKNMLVEELARREWAQKMEMLQSVLVVGNVCAKLAVVVVVMCLLQKACRHS